QVEVWPGDANNDGKVDVDDQHPIGYNYKFKIKPRDTRSTEWKAWLVIRRKGDQMVFSDTNGDGLINETDTIAIHQNLLKEHKLTEALKTNGFRYEYDKNGNMVYDEYKKISISYNLFNLPDTITAAGQGKIVNQYLADGTLLRRSIFDADDNEVQRIDYQGEFLFVNNQLDKIFTEEGYYSQLSDEEGETSTKDGKGKYYYTLADHLGHTRVVVDEDENVIQETAYYPYGTPIAALSSETKYNYLYTGKEFLDNFGLNWYDHHARYFDPEVGRWWAIDPALQSASPYMAMGNNPMMYTDADGKMWNPFKAIGRALDYAWGKANQFAQWADQVGIPSVNAGYGISSSGQIQPVGDFNGNPLFSNESQYEVASQNAVNAINNARGDYFGQQQMNANYSQQLNDRIMSIPYTSIQKNKNIASAEESGYIYGNPESDILWTISATSAASTQILTINTLAETIYRRSTLLPRFIDINTGGMTWANPNYAKFIKITKPIGLGGDIANSLGIIYNISDQGATTGNILDAIMGIIGYYPILGDMVAGDYAAQKYNINQVVKGRARIGCGTMGPIYQYVP
ncbi:RHS repeat domain-containing protein, partial [Labilibaculum euxinus]